MIETIRLLKDHTDWAILWVWFSSVSLPPESTPTGQESLYSLSPKDEGWGPGKGQHILSHPLLRCLGVPVCVSIFSPLTCEKHLGRQVTYCPECNYYTKICKLKSCVRNTISSIESISNCYKTFAQTEKCILILRFIKAQTSSYQLQNPHYCTWHVVCVH